LLALKTYSWPDQHWNWPVQQYNFLINMVLAAEISRSPEVKLILIKMALSSILMI